MVVTNAILKTISYNPSDIDTKKGEIKTGKLKTIDRDWVMFDHPLPDELQLRGSYNDSYIQPIKRPTYILSASNAIDLMESICDDAEY